MIGRTLKSKFYNHKTGYGKDFTSDEIITKLCVANLLTPADHSFLKWSVPIS